MMEEFFSAALEVVLGLLEHRFETVQNPILRAVLQIGSMIAACAAVLAMFFFICWLVAYR